MAAAEPRDEHKPHRRIRVRLPSGAINHDYLMAFGFKVPNAVAVTMYRNPHLPAVARVYNAIVLGCVQDAKHPAVFADDDRPGELAEISAMHLVEATGLSRASVYRSIKVLARNGSIEYIPGDAQNAPSFAVCLNPPEPS
jgi:hypothetical protein